ncbi:unnamed protein product [Effrenium voratum]|uniref:Uncharacterized protein n=1 Tax=Effrenium voratum TaxID=2562239 RepID=A0AA36J1H2_9DINO|nr:unnamed protein product [Effrenium voratum]
MASRESTAACDAATHLKVFLSQSKAQNRQRLRSNNSRGAWCNKSFPHAFAVGVSSRHGMASRESTAACDAATHLKVFLSQSNDQNRQRLRSNNSRGAWCHKSFPHAFAVGVSSRHGMASRESTAACDAATHLKVFLSQSNDQNRQRLSRLRSTNSRGAWCNKSFPHAFAVGVSSRHGMASRESTAACDAATHLKVFLSQSKDQNRQRLSRLRSTNSRGAMCNKSFPHAFAVGVRSRHGMASRESTAACDAATHLKVFLSQSNDQNRQRLSRLRSTNSRGAWCNKSFPHAFAVGVSSRHGMASRESTAACDAATHLKSFLSQSKDQRRQRHRHQAACG